MRSRGQSGQAIVLIALMLTVLIGMVAIAVDGSRAYALRRDIQDATDAAALAAGDKLQQSGSYVTAEQAATSIFASNLRLYSSPSCTGYGTPGASPWTVTCTFADGTVLTDVARRLGPQGSRFDLTATRTLALQFGRVLTNGTSPTLGAAANGGINNLLYTPTIGALNQSGCGGSGGNAIVVNGSGTLNVTGDVVSNGAVSMAAGAVRVAGDIYARCQSPVPGNVGTLCYPSGSNPPCTYPDVAGATRSGNRLADPGYPAPGPLGASQGLPSNSVVLQSGIYSAPVFLSSNRCWFLSGGVYVFQSGAVNVSDFVSNELKPPDEPSPSNNTQRSPNQFWDTAGVSCDGTFDLTRLAGGPRDLGNGQWAFLVTSTRTDTYNGVSYTRESAPSMCRAVSLPNHYDHAEVRISNVPGATGYNIYAQPPPGNCNGPFGFASNVPVASTPQNDSLAGCPSVTGGCSLGFVTKILDVEIAPPWAPNSGAAPGTPGAYPPDSERAPLAPALPNQNPATGAGATGDRANENNCKSIAGAFVSCPGPVTPGAVALYFPAGGCLTTGNGADTYLFSGYQYNWLSLYEPPANTCTNFVGAESNSAFIGLMYTPGATLWVSSPNMSQAAGVGGMLAASFLFTGSLPSITYSSMYGPVPPAGRLTG